VVLLIVPRRRTEVEPLDGAVTPETPFPVPPADGSPEGRAAA
jgi:hypothetical protein